MIRFERFFVESTTSTMDEARRLSAGRERGVVSAGTQSAGRGRLAGRAWVDEPGSSLLATFWLPAADYAGAPPPLVAGLLVLEAVRAWAASAGARLEPGPALKWPNDLLVGGRKLAGLLCESSGGLVYAGVGVNCGQTDFPPGLRTEPTSLRLETGLAPAPEELLDALVAAAEGIGTVARGWKARYAAAMAWRGEPVAFRPGLDGPPIHGALVGVDGSGAALISPEGEPDGQAAAFSSGELHRRY